MSNVRFFAIPMLLVAGSLAAQNVAPARPAAGAGNASDAPAFADYRPFRDEPLTSWRAANDEMRRLGGHAGQAGTPDALPPPPSSAAAPATPMPTAPEAKR